MPPSGSMIFTPLSATGLWEAVIMTPTACVEEKKSELDELVLQALCRPWWWTLAY